LDAERSSILLVDSTGVEGAQLLSKTSSHTGYQIKPNGDSPVNQDFIARSSVSVPLRARPILVGKERNMLEERMIGNLTAFDKIHGMFDSEDTQLLGILASQTSTILQIATLFGQANELFLDFIKVLVATIDAKDPYTRGHSKRVSDISVAIAQDLGLRGDLVHDIRLGSLLHDIGKIHIPDHLLTKPGELSEDEYEMVKTHPGAGYQIMKEVRLLQNVLPAIIEHHELLDGSGYPLGLSSDQISLMGRIVTVADVYDAVTSDRPYRKAMDAKSAIEYMQKYSGLQYDEECVHFLSERIMREERQPIS
jgi:putative nucleotidyltransferase with HDIG domain